MQGATAGFEACHEGVTGGQPVEADAGFKLAGVGEHGKSGRSGLAGGHDGAHSGGIDQGQVACENEDVASRGLECGNDSAQRATVVEWIGDDIVGAGRDDRIAPANKSDARAKNGPERSDGAIDNELAGLATGKRLKQLVATKSHAPTAHKDNRRAVWKGLGGRAGHGEQCNLYWADPFGPTFVDQTLCDFPATR